MKKSLEQREKELRDSLALLQDSLIKVQQDDANYLKIIAGQLRALVCFGGRSLNPLLLNLADEKKVVLKCYGYPVEEILELGHNIVLALPPSKTISHEPAPGLKPLGFKEWLNSTYLCLGKYKYTPNEIIRMVAEKEGGAHYDDALPEKLTKIKGIIYHKSSVQYNETEKLLVQTAEMALHFGKLILNKNLLWRRGVAEGRP